MKNSLFLAYCALIVSGFLSAHLLFEKSLDPTRIFEIRLSEVEKAKQDAELRARLTAHHLADYKQHVATLLPGMINGLPEEAAYPLRQLASVSGAAGEPIVIERATGVFEKAKALFREKRFAEASVSFEEIIAKFPESAHLPEAHFLLAEAQFQQKDLESSIATIEKMVEIYPENELTGFALLRLGSIFEIEDRLEDASEIYRSVLGNFKNSEVSKQASASLKAVAL